VTQKLPRICVAQAEAANPLYQAYRDGYDKFHAVTAKPTLASAIQIGNPVSVKKAIRTLQRFDGVVEQASEVELSDAAARADRTGLFNCPHTGVALAALEKLVGRGQIGPEHRVVVVSTANGLKFTDFKVRYHEGQLGPAPATGASATATAEPRYANHPTLLPNEYVAVRDSVRRILD
jgi:threonine synthase